MTASFPTPFAPASLAERDVPLPRELQVEVTGACNLRCRMCLVSYRPGLNKREGSLDFATFRSVVDELPDLRGVTLQGLGEPLLCPDLYRMVEYAARRGVRVGFNSNATLLTRSVARRLVGAGLDWLHLSLDGASAATYESIRRGSSFARVRDNIRGLVEVIRAEGAERPALSVVFVAMRRNLDELPAVVRLTAGFGIPRLWVQNLSHTFSDTDPAGAYRGIRRFTAGEVLWRDDADPGPDEHTADVFARAERLAERLGVRLRLPPHVAQTPPPRRADEPGCDWPWRSAYLTHEGLVQPCCMVMGSDRATLGDTRTRPFGEIWSARPYQDFRAALRGPVPPEVCRGCALYRNSF